LGSGALDHGRLRSARFGGFAGLCG
jgi:hypothetical protein